MKVILLQDVAKIGRRHETVDVPNGYAQNKLIPQGMALPATPANEKRMAAKRQHVADTAAATEQNFVAALSTLADTSLTITRDANEQGHLYEALRATEVVAAAKSHGVTLEASQIVLSEPIKTTGTHQLEIREGEHTGMISVEIVAS